MVGVPVPVRRPVLLPGHLQAGSGRPRGVSSGSVSVHPQAGTARTGQVCSTDHSQVLLILLPILFLLHHLLIHRLLVASLVSANLKEYAW